MHLVLLTPQVLGVLQPAPRHVPGRALLLVHAWCVHVYVCAYAYDKWLGGMNDERTNERTNERMHPSGQPGCIHTYLHT